MAADGAFLTQGGAPQTVRGGGGLRASRVGGTAARTPAASRPPPARTAAPAGTAIELLSIMARRREQNNRSTSEYPSKQKSGVHVLQLQTKEESAQKACLHLKAESNDGVNAMREGRQKYSGHKVYAVACVPKRAQQHDKPQHQHKNKAAKPQTKNPSAAFATGETLDTSSFHSSLLSDCGASNSLCNLHKNPAAISVLLFG